MEFEGVGEKYVLNSFNFDITNFLLSRHITSHARAEGLSASTGAICNHCGKVLASANYLKDHILSVHENKSLKIRCKHCEEVFATRSSHRKHINTVHFPNK